MNEDILITRRNPAIQTFYAQAKEITSTIESLKDTMRTPLAGHHFIDDYTLSRKLSLSRRTLQTYRDNLTIPYYRVGGKIIYDEAEIEAWLTANYHPRF